MNAIVRCQSLLATFSTEIMRDPDEHGRNMADAEVHSSHYDECEYKLYVRPLENDVIIPNSLPPNVHTVDLRHD